MHEDADVVDQPVSYFSFKFNKHQVNYYTFEKKKKTLALLLALQHLKFVSGQVVCLW